MKDSINILGEEIDLENFPALYKWATANKAGLENTIKKIQIDNDFDGLSKFFLFKSMKNISSGFSENWIDLDNNFVNL